MISPSSYGYCATAASCGCDGADGAGGGQSKGGFAIRRHDTCPPLVVDVKGEGGKWIDLTGWEATGTLFTLSKIVADLGSDAVGDTVVSMDSVANVHVGDILRVESPDGPEKMLVLSVDRMSDTLAVTRGYEGSQVAAHLMDAEAYAVKASGVPVEVEMAYQNEGSAADYVVVTMPTDSSAGVTQFPAESQRLTRTSLKVNWRPSDTSRVGSYYLQIELSNQDQSKRLTLPKGALGFPVRILVDANDN